VTFLVRCIFLSGLIIYEEEMLLSPTVYGLIFYDRTGSHSIVVLEDIDEASEAQWTAGPTVRLVSPILVKSRMGIRAAVMARGPEEHNYSMLDDERE